jgi:nitrite reductase/ring-hydroxylating ferredoxin subunit
MGRGCAVARSLARELTRIAAAAHARGMSGEDFATKPETARHRVCAVWDVPRGGVKVVTIAGVDVGIFNLGGKFFAYRNVCPHAGAPVCSGKITGTALASGVYTYEWGRPGEILRCPWHGWEFDLRTGAHLASDARLRDYRVSVEGDEIFIEL